MTTELPANPTDADIQALLKKVKRIAVVGLSPKAYRDSHRVSAYMQRKGYEIIPVYPREDLILGARVYRTVSAIEGSVDLVNVFRRSEELPAVAADILGSSSASLAAVWFQFDCVHEGAIVDLVNAGRPVVYDRCLMVDHGRLI